MKIGAYAVERDYSHYVAYAAKTVLAVVGTATKGPVGKARVGTDGKLLGYEGVATVCTSAQDLVNKFGTLKVGYHGLYAGQYFLSQSSKLYFVRAASASAAESSTLIAGVTTNEDDVLDALTVKALELGTYADGYTMEVSKGTTASTYNLVLKDRAGAILESIQEVDLESLTSTYVANRFKITATNPSAVRLTPGSYKLAGGNDGADDITDADYINAANALAADQVDMNLFAVPGNSESSVITAMLSLAETRGDCLYLVDPPMGLDRDGIVQWRKGGESFNHAAFNSSYGALYYDWEVIYDSVNKERVNVPPSVVVSASIAYSDRISEVWYAPAGLDRGIVRGTLDTMTKLSKSDVEYLYENNINCIYDDPQIGLVLWGQKTLYQENTALNRINVRRLMNYLKRVISAACNYLTFEPNDRITWNSFEMKVTPVLDSIRSRRGISDYQIVRGATIVTDDDIDNYRMPCMIMVRPTKSAEEIPIYFTITSTGADFNEVLEANGVMDVL